MKILRMVGASSDAPVLRAIGATATSQVMFHTGPHYDFNVAEVFFQLAKAKNEHDLVNGDLVTKFCEKPEICGG